MHEAAERSSLGALEPVTAERLARFDRIRLAQRLAEADCSLWSDDPTVADRIAQRLGWIGSPRLEPDDGAEVPAAAGTVMLLGMGGSSLGAEASARAFGAAERLRIVDSTVPDVVLSVEPWLPEVTDVVVASKSGGTLETAVLADYFEARCDARVRFHAVTDPGSELESRAVAGGYASCHLNAPDIGGRFSVLSRFGSVPLALAGVDVEGIWKTASAMAEQCAELIAEDNPGLWLGAILAAAGDRGRDKLLLHAAPGLEGLADWIEQLVAESTGKDGVGLVPVTRPEFEGSTPLPSDRTVVLLEWAGEDAAAQDQVADWAQAEVPILRFVLGEPADIGAEFYRWQVAVAAAGAAMGINPFDEPDVASAKRRTGALLQVTQSGGGSADLAPDWSGDSVQLFAPGMADRTADEILEALMRPIPGGYVGLLAFLSPAAPQDSMRAVRAALGGPNPVILGWGPGYLHSSGQLHKGGPAAGRFLMLTADPSTDVGIPGRPWTFGEVAQAQALGDACALAEAGRMVVRAHLRGPHGPAIAELLRLLHQARESSKPRKGMTDEQT